MDIEKLLKYTPWRFRHYVRSLIGKNGQGLWRFIPNLGYRVVIPWPSRSDTSDLNILVRPWLEENVGKQGRFWSWEYYYMGYSEHGHPVDAIKVRFLRKNDAILFKLRFA